jgi:C4-dicarboxylate-specific signal transduction histidine kinase
MAVKPLSQAFVRSYILPSAIAALALGIFIVDILTPPEFVFGVLYVGVVLLADRFCGPPGVLLFAAGCTGLELLDYFLGDTDAANTAISIAAIGTTTFLIRQTQRARKELDQAQTELARVTRVTTLGELAAAIAHEVNQPLTGLVSSGNACLRWLASDPPNLEAARRSVERMINDGSRAGEVIAGIRAMVRKSPSQRGRLNINDVIMEVVTLLSAEIQRNRLSLQTELASDLPLIMGDRVQLQQVILNLMMNAIDAMSQTRQSQRDLSVASVMDGSDAVLVTVRDSGPGLDETALERLFDAFYTTKPDGIGMGLAITQRIVEAHGGQIWATPNTPRGAKFEFRLPTDGPEPP